MISLKTAIAMLSVTGILAIIGCRNEPDVGIEILDRSVSPDREFEAIAFQATGGGAAGFVQYYVMIYPPGRARPSIGDSANQVLMATRADGLSVRWAAADRSGSTIYGPSLEIACNCPQGAIWDQRALWNGHRIVVAVTK